MRFTILGLAAAFVAVAYFSYAYFDALEDFALAHPVAGPFIFISIEIIDVVFAPGSTLALVPIAGRLWGPWLGTLFTMIGWVAGSFLAFFFAHRFGRPWVRRLVSARKLESIRRILPKHLFWGVVFFRLVLPLDVTSYAIGLFTPINYRKYLTATAIGVAPGAFFLSFLGTLPLLYQAVLFSAAVIITYFYIRRTGLMGS
ncbi:MAG: hypothetical protein A3C88_01610 [Candidatus Yanofskybacteria bacterium RIFCSPHIGHO2_02_FULL_50_12]|uniref:TVP38/TMEM64 family membrane protein n=1 Tax=Candidatus Yanofskybacteria bacterium RIFCSPHIGHO2_02_FULL_50_12 TaxID=1802685 RepID=A0A1F8FXN6_9BACT|nr:MAG: hypothetical protein A3C88_01610 [Candidatus Yanofskybacteria bacterium RIFCSPHIGHO2_02_FULL_50_12]